jgi:hypothetical protein
MVDESTGTEVALLAWYVDRVPGIDPAPGYHKDTVALVPQATLPPGVTIRVEFDGVIRQEPVSLRWRFTTGSREL